METGRCSLFPTATLTYARSHMSGVPEGILLVVEDDADLRAAVVEIIASTGQRVSMAKDGLEALTWLEVHGRPRLVLLDMGMPRMTGHDFLVRVARHWPGLAVVAMTTRPIHHPGVLDTLLKPFDLETLLERLPIWLSLARDLPRP
ncbi:Response regulator receiver domain-containing protein [Myxococcus fulvus]|uniref:Response regulator receiver domain-containing protein n=2 Tax=Myxococcus fulvus TaxID=33 RepID=A0A511THA3_MYXFU|nr:hypothetical protein MFU01_85840 [Myxococcus fulvus]SEU37293.1 Response regulator receiver domain-containing protein [Myxococcus fulvus]